MDGGRWLPAEAAASGPSVPLTRVPRRQYLNANGWDTGWDGWGGRVATGKRQFNGRYRLFWFLESGNGTESKRRDLSILYLYYKKDERNRYNFHQN